MQHDHFPRYAPKSGIGRWFDARLPATRWAMAAGVADDSTDQWVVVQNPGDRSAFVTLSLLADGSPVTVGNLSSIEVRPGQRRAFNINPLLKRATTPLLVVATEPVVVERDLYKLRAFGLAMSPAIPLR